ncbi:PfkB family carbohydrate kinase [Nocardioides sp. InS609-2]|uniref:PfkB family carbohydrate kinase n=1 Tax=Nocardioides sp. InS609-2 TaxID=2760705 RepID=UPI0020C0FE96|nr:PfkB family carbohydrate kinase [Nocardioides sp. InS609-2]
MEPLQDDAFLVIGESLIDVVHAPGQEPVEHVGGSAANAAVALARLGRSVWFASALGADDRGRRIRSHLHTEGIRWAVEPLSLERTSAAVAELDDGGVATYTFDIAWQLHPLREDLPAPVVVQVSSLAPTREPGADHVLAVVHRYRDRALVAYDVNLRPAITGTGPAVVAAVEAMVALSDVVKASDEDLEGLYGDLDEQAAVAHLLTLGPAAVVVTRGGDGAGWYGGGVSVEIAAQAGPVVDTIGAGDTFGAAMVDALATRGCVGTAARGALTALGADEVRDVLARAAHAAAITVSRAGANPPYARELG